MWRRRCPDPLLPLPRTPSQAVGPQPLSPMLSIDDQSHIQRRYPLRTEKQARWVAVKDVLAYSRETLYGKGRHDPNKNDRTQLTWGYRLMKIPTTRWGCRLKHDASYKSQHLTLCLSGNHNLSHYRYRGYNRNQVVHQQCLCRFFSLAWPLVAVIEFVAIHVLPEF